MKRIIAFLLALSMVLSMAACGAPAQPQEKPDDTALQQDNTDQMDRQDKELVAELIGGTDASDLTDQELDTLVDQLIGETEKEAGVVNLSTQKTEPKVEFTPDPDAYDEEGGMKQPFDQVYPELIEKGQVAFSGESILIKLKSGKLTDGLQAAGVGALHEIVPLEKAAWYEAKLTEGTDPKEAIQEVRQLEEVLLAEYNYEVQTAALDDYKHFDKDKDEEFKKNGHNKDQWHFHYVGIPDGYEEMETEGGDPSVIVAVIDSGVDYTHEDLKDNMWVNTKEIPDNNIDDDKNGYIDDYYGVDIVAGKGNGDDTNGHGTHVAGIVAARNNNVGTLGVAYNVKIMSVKAAMHNGTLNQADIAEAVLYAYNHGAEVINMSFGGTACSIAVQDALATAYTRCVLVASAGNNGAKNEGLMALPNYPAALTYVLGVMSVDGTGRESAFTNYDTIAFNGVEYELYAPGENIMSTLPGNQYGYLSGTSMAAPIVSSFAAILRSEFTDRDKYPTKFIYGQLASTSGYYADCLDPQLHGAHNLPQIVNLNDALTKLPKPEVGVQDYALFDDPKYSSKNNGDGVIDAGETIALGLTLRNRWGMSENTLVTIDTISESSGMADPYITIQNPTVNYGSVGTYSTQDCGKVYTDELHTGWEDPFLITISKDCPNDYRFTLNITVTCENALDAEDDTVYESEGAIDENVRSGYILPAVIDQDMVLTKDNLYIIPNATVIQAGVTVRVEPGTHIQFWSDDANDPYASDYIAYLLVNGNFLVEGTKEEPVYIYPSQLMGHHGVEIGSSASGYVSMKYADITNFFYATDHTGTGNNIDLADHCTFRNNYSGFLYYRYLSSGVVKSSSTSQGIIGHINAKDSVFYKLAFSSYTYLFGTFDRCIFTQCGIDFSSKDSNHSTTSYQNCVFLNNAMVDQTKPDTYYNSSFAFGDKETILLRAGKSAISVYYRPETATTYVRYEAHAEDNTYTWYSQRQLKMLEYIRKVYGGNWFVAEDLEEYEWLCSKMSDSFNCGLRQTEQGLSWADGTPLPPEFTIGTVSTDYNYYWYIHSKYSVRHYFSSYALYEVPGYVLPENITFMEYTEELDTGSTYQIQPQSTPVQLPVDGFVYESTDETVLTVSKTGLVTPMSKGTADVWVWSLDKAVRNRITFTVADYVPLEGISFTKERLKMAYGETVSTSCILYPENTTRKNPVYASSDETIATVDKFGNVTAVGFGEAVITATCDGKQAQLPVQVAVDHFTLVEKHLYVPKDGSVQIGYLVEPINTAASAVHYTSADETVATVDALGKITGVSYGVTTISVQCAAFTASLEVQVYQKTGILSFASNRIPVFLEEEYTELPKLRISEGADTKLVWKSTDEEVAKIEDGKLHMFQCGATLLMVEDLYSGKTASAYVFVYDKPFATAVNAYYYSSSRFVYRENGTIEMWTPSSSGWNPIIENVDACSITHNHILAAQEDGTLIEWRSEKYYQTLTDFVGTKIRDVAAYYNSYNYGLSSYYVLTEDGSVYSWGGNTYGQLGTGNTSNVSLPTKLELGIRVVQIEAASGMLFLRAENGNLYILGGSSACAKSPMLIDRNTSHLQGNFMYGGLYYADGNLMSAPETGETPYVVSAIGEYDYLNFYSNNYSSANAGGHYYNGVGVRDGKLTIIRGTYKNGVSTLKETETAVTGVAATAAYISGNQYYDPIVFFKDGTYGTVSLSGVVNYINPAPVAQTELKLLGTNLQDGVLRGDSLQLYFNKGISSCSTKLYEDGVALTVNQKCKDNSVTVTSTLGFGDGCTYRLVIEPANITGIASCSLAKALELEFVYKASKADMPETEVEPEEPDYGSSGEVEEPVIYETIVDESIERILTPARVVSDIKAFIAETQCNPTFYGNAILNPISTDTNVEHWLRIQAPTVSVGTYSEIPLGGNYWGTTDQRAIELQMIDYADFPTNYAHLLYAPYLTEAPENTFPFVTSVKLFNKNGDEVKTVGNEQVTFQVKFNRDMDTAIPLQVRFGSAYPYGDYEIAGKYVDARTWEGVYTLNTVIENGNQFFTISNGCSATEDLPLQIDQHRFGFVIDTTAAQALTMQGTATDTGVSLRWTQDDFDTLMGYNVYRATSEDGLYTRLNKTVIPAKTMEWFDDTVEPGKVYYYNFTVVQTDLAESEPSGKIAIMSKDTMAPNIYHSPVSSAFTGANLVLGATVTDNLNIAYANLYYRVAGTETWSTIRMNKLNDQYSAIIPASYITVAGVEYYIEAFDGVSFTYKGSVDAPYTVAVQQAIDANALGDVDGDGVITNLDALKLLYAINDKYNMKPEEFARADLNGDGQLWAAEALRILQYVSGAVGSVKM